MTHKIGALFDLDGVLVDTEDIYTEFWAYVDGLYPTNVKNFAHIIKGNTLTAILNTYYPNLEIQKKIFKLLVEHERTMQYRMFDGVDTFLSKLKEIDMPMAIVTSSDNKKMENLYKAIPGFYQYFDAVITASNVTRSKPDPQGYLLAAKAIGIPPELCVVFEDSFAGINAGHRAGAKVIGIATTQAQEDIEPLADLTVNILTDLTISQIQGLFK